ncbi:major capsid protein [Microbispora sp. RL4-1S]|uniref:Major capsid protein n=1 Tax=Microbispora oryzae TaxID=2806554 RepID=A0A940WIQ2_9ACTN|nr:major capsid protein [Microbispora oryzae]MBP2703518.1 major capsid protein [Microbispora oryzae]
MTLQELLDLIAAGNTDALAAALADKSLDLRGLENEALDAFQAIRARQGEGLTDDDMNALEALAAAVETVRAEDGRREQAIAEQAAAADAIAARITPSAEGETGDGETAGEGEGGESGDQVADEGGEQPAEGEQQVEAVAAAATPPAPQQPSLPAPRPAPRVNLSQIRRHAPTQTPPNPRGAALLAAANVPGVNAGETLDVEQLAVAAISRFGTMPTPNQNYSGRVQHGLAVIRKDVPDELRADGANDDEVLALAADEHRLPGGSLTAAGGWCAPSETWYDIACERETMAGLLSIPEVNATRGGIRWTQGPDFSELYSHSGYFIQTEAQAEAATPKPCFEIPCEDFQECRLDAIGVCLSAGILTNRAWPELIARFIRGTLVAHAHRYNAETIRRMVAGSTTINVPANQFSAAVDTLGAIELQVWDYRYRHRMSPEATLEMVAPFWLLGVLRSDLAKRNAYDDPLNVSDADIRSWFAMRGVSAQFVYDWQDGYGTPPGTIGGATPPTQWPATVELLLYAAGTWVRATQDIITLDAVYDSTLFKINRYNALFTEEGVCVIMRCPDSRRLVIPICPTGHSSAQIEPVCVGV